MERCWCVATAQREFAARVAGMVAERTAIADPVMHVLPGKKSSRKGDRQGANIRRKEAGQQSRRPPRNSCATAAKKIRTTRRKDQGKAEAESITPEQVTVLENKTTEKEVVAE